jgi:hypothetical protein
LKPLKPKGAQPVPVPYQFSSDGSSGMRVGDGDLQIWLLIVLLTVCSVVFWARHAHGHDVPKPQGSPLDWPATATAPHGPSQRERKDRAGHSSDAARLLGAPVGHDAYHLTSAPWADKPTTLGDGRQRDAIVNASQREGDER